MDKVRRVGEAVALIVAESLDQAKDAAELAEVDYEPLPQVTDAAEAVKPGAPQLWEGAPGNICLEVERGDQAATDAAFAGAAHCVVMELRNNRVAPITLEPRAQIVAYDPETDHYTVHAGSSRSFLHKKMLVRYLGVEDDQVHVISGDVGGSYGMRGGGYPENLLATWAAARLGRPVKWVCERSEGMISDAQARDLITHGELALDADGRFLALRIRHLYDCGTHGSNFAPLNNGVRLITSNYDIPTAHLVAKAVMTNTLPTGTYRGAGRPEAIFNLERLIDRAAAATGIDRVELRRRNLIEPDALPYMSPMEIPYDCGEFELIMDKCLALADWAGFEARRRASRAKGRLRGIGLANYIQTPTGQLTEWTSVEVTPAGGVEVIIGTDSSGQGHETSFAQVISDWLGVPFDCVRLITGDTDRVKDGGGSHSDRSMRLGGTILVEASDGIIARGKRIAAHLLEAAVSDLEFAEGRFTVSGTDRSVGIFEVAAAAAGSDLPADLAGPLRAEADIARRLPAYPNGCAVCEVEVDAETGAVRIERYAAIDDVGRAINPMIVDGQSHGSITQGIGQALLEDVVYDPRTGQVLSGSLMDYCVPRADDLPFFAIDTHQVPAPSNPLGVKGGGEGGTVSALGAVINAVVHALEPLGVTDIRMPATPERVWRAIRAAKEAG
jgi:carbon-monoxide dehydrogenase large subunit